MKIKADLNVNGNSRISPLLVLKPEETIEHLALRFAALLIFFNENPVLDVRADDPMISNVSFMPDLLVSDPVDGILIWIECGNTASNKLIKVARRTKNCRFVILKSNVEEGIKTREILKKNIRGYERIEILAFPEGEFEKWTEAVTQTESPYVFGEASIKGLNLVLNQTPFDIQLIPC
ncbi:MAG: YaeQ family protein [Elusimicrobiales bacterium]|nr:YaeQ family protein [Elusimicrobiales bacterium]